MLLRQSPQGRDEVRIPLQKLDEIEDVAPLPAPETPEPLGLVLRGEDPEAGRVLAVERAERKGPASRLPMQRNALVLEDATHRHDLPELPGDSREGRIVHRAIPPDGGTTSSPRYYRSRRRVGPHPQV